jgi:D-alanyl-D-alanine carboxypeptidase
MLTIKNNHNRIFERIIFSVLITTAAGCASFIGISYAINQQKLDKQHQEIMQQIQEVKRIADAKEAKRLEPVYISLPNAQPVRAIVSDYHQTDNIWKLVNKNSPIPDTFSPANLKIPNVYTHPGKSNEERSVRTDIEQPLIDMFSAAQADGYSLMIGSGYRSSNLQSIYFNSLAAEVGEAEANQSIAIPGQSEHQTGLAVDISTVARNCYLSDCFAETDDGVWLANNSYKYGFIIRYPKGKESITGYSYEPWHFRFVGVELATAIYTSGLTFDEAQPYIETARNQLISNEAIVL